MIRLGVVGFGRRMSEFILTYHNDISGFVHKVG